MSDVQLTPENQAAYDQWLAVCGAQDAPASSVMSAQPRRRGRPVKGSVSLSVVDAVREACRLRTTGMYFDEIGRVMGISKQRAHQLVAQGKRESLIAAGDQVIEYELGKLEEYRAEAERILFERAPLVSAGEVVTDTVMDEKTGLPVIDTRTGQELRVKLQDRSAALAALGHLTRISERIAKLKGLDAPKRVETTHRDETSGPRIVFANGDEYKDALRQALEAMRPAYTQRIEVVDVVAVEAPNGNA
jgi:hypothetical protein